MDFLRNNDLFSFTVDDTPFSSLNYTKTVTEIDNVITTEYLFDSGLKVTNIAKKYTEHGAYEWVNYFENTSSEPTGIIGNVFDCDVTVPLENDDITGGLWLPDYNTCTKLYVPIGSQRTPYEFSTDTSIEAATHFKQGMEANIYASNGVSSEGHAPFFNINKANKGYIFAIGWSGGWDSITTRLDGAVRFRSGILGVKFKMLPGEKFRTSSIVILPYECDYIESQNKWRRLVKDKFSIIGKNGRRKSIPFYAVFWGGLPSEKVLERLDILKKYDIPYEGLWLDAGWYGKDTKYSESDSTAWCLCTGDWQVSPHIHKNGLKDVKQYLTDNGKDEFLLWYEPERVARGVSIVQEHPEYLLQRAEPIRNVTRDTMLNLGDESAWQYCYETISKSIEELGVNCYRQDFNMSPTVFWDDNLEADRKGILEIKHINGLYKFWDALLERFPNLIIDNCAGGGRRIDIETMRRSVPLWRTDLECFANNPSENTQTHTQSYAAWLPYSGTGTNLAFDMYDYRSSYCSGTTLRWVGEGSGVFVDFEKDKELLQKAAREYLLIRDYFSEDFYPLTKLTLQTDAWCASQYNRPENGDGIVLVYRREDSPIKSSEFVLRGLEAGAKYRFEDLDGGEPIILDADEIMSSGFEVVIPQKRSAKVFVYHKL